ncbi:MAG: LacI family DNA-binding transcriptional regulator, partial [Pseudomonadota bacterium]
MMPAKVTSIDVARRAGVSQSAVSRVFTPGASASAKTAAKVRRAAEELGYRPNVLARSLITGRSRIIGLVVAYLDNQFYPVALQQLSRALQAEGYHVMVFLASNAEEDTDAVVAQMLDYQVDGIVAASVALGSHLAERARAAGIPLVMFNRSGGGAGVSTVTSDNRAGGVAVADFLMAHAPDRIGYIAGWDGASTQRDREAGFRAGLAQAGRTIDARGAGDFDLASATAAARQMFDTDAPPDALFVANDHMAFAVMDELRAHMAIRIPDDVIVVGYDDVPAAAWGAYDLTTVRQRAERMVDETVTLLMERIGGGSAAPQ